MALHWAKQVVGQVQDMDPLVNDQVKTFAGQGTLVFKHPTKSVIMLRAEGGVETKYFY